MNPSEQKLSRMLIIAAFATVYLVWGSTYLAIRFAIETLPPFLMAGVRFLVAGSLFYALIRKRQPERLSAANWLSAVVVGGLMLFGGNGLVSRAEQTVPSGLAALMIATVPLWMVLLDWAFFGGQRPRATTVLGLLVGLAGVALLIGPAELSHERVNPFGAVALLAACVFWTIGSLYSRRANLPRSTHLSVAMQMLGGGAVLVVVGTLAGEWPRVDLSAVSAKSLLSLGYLIVFGSILALSAYTWLLRTCSAAHVATYAYVNPMIAVFLGYVFASEPLTPRTLAAAALIICAVGLMTLTRQPAPSKRPYAAKEQPEPAAYSACCIAEEQEA